MKQGGVGYYEGLEWGGATTDLMVVVMGIRAARKARVGKSTDSIYEGIGALKVPHSTDVWCAGQLAAEAPIYWCFQYCCLSSPSIPSSAAENGGEGEGQPGQH